MSEDTRARGLIQAANIVSDAARNLPKVRWWQLGAKKLHQMQILTEVMEKITDEVGKIHDEQMAKLLPNPIHKQGE